MARFKYSDADKYGSGTGTRFFALKDDKDTAQVRFMYSSVDDIECFAVHQLDVKGDAQTGLSGFMRIFRGYYVYDAMSPIEKVIGADDGKRIDSAIASSSVAWSFKDNDYYFNVVQTLLIRTGIIGTIIFLLFMLSSFRSVNSCGKAILTILLFLSFISAIHFTPVMALYILLALSCNKEYEQRKSQLSPKAI